MGLMDEIWIILGYSKNLILDFAYLISKIVALNFSGEPCQLDSRRYIINLQNENACKN